MKLPSLVLMFACGLLSACHYYSAKSDNFDEAARYNVQLGLTYLKQGDRSKAKIKLLKALTQAPNQPEVNAAMAWYLERCGDVNQARIYYQKALKFSANQGAQLNNYGAFLCRHGQYKEAESYFQKAIKDVQYEHTAAAYENAGLCAEAIPDYAKATAYFEKALEQDPARPQSLYELARIKLKLGHKQKAQI